MATVISSDQVHNAPPVPVHLSSKDVHNPPGRGTHSPSEPAPEHLDRLARALRDLDQWRARRGEHGAEWTARRTGKTHRVGDRVSVNGRTGRIVRKHPSSGLPEIQWDKEHETDEPKPVNTKGTTMSPSLINNWRTAREAMVPATNRRNR
jgi:hypothetical protein